MIDAAFNGNRGEVLSVLIRPEQVGGGELPRLLNMRAAIRLERLIDGRIAIRLARLLPDGAHDVAAVLLGEEFHKQPLGIPGLFGGAADVRVVEQVGQVADAVGDVRVDLHLHPRGGGFVKPNLRVKVVIARLNDMVEFMRHGRFHQVQRDHAAAFGFLIVIVQRDIAVSRVSLALRRFGVIAGVSVIALGVPGDAIGHQVLDVNVKAVIAAFALIAGRGRPTHLIDFRVPRELQRGGHFFDVIGRAARVGIGVVHRDVAAKRVVDQEAIGRVDQLIGDVRAILPAALRGSGCGRPSGGDHAYDQGRYTSNESSVTYHANVLSYMIKIAFRLPVHTIVYHGTGGKLGQTNL